MLEVFYELRSLFDIDPFESIRAECDGKEHEIKSHGGYFLMQNSYVGPLEHNIQEYQQKR